MARSSTKAARLLQIETLMMAHPEGLTPAEIARRLDVQRYFPFVAGLERTSRGGGPPKRTRHRSGALNHEPAHPPRPARDRRVLSPPPCPAAWRTTSTTRVKLAMVSTTLRESR